MIRLTRMNGNEFTLNSELIKYLEETPDTVITLINGERLLILEKIDDVVDRVIEYGRKIRTLSVE